MTWLDAWYGLVMAILVVIGHWLVQGLWLGIGDPASWMVHAVVMFIGTLVGRPALRAFAADRTTRSQHQ